MALDDRYIPLDGSRNFRDFGGYPTRCGSTVKRKMLFRSDGLWKLSDADLAILNPLVIRTICDLRRSKEREMMPTRWLDDIPINHLHLPLLPEDGTSTLEKLRHSAILEKNADGARQVMIDLYRSMVSEEAALRNLRQLFELIAREDELPVLIHCSGGKDRTGISCALILSTLGVADADVMEDYLHSQALYCDRVDLARAATQVFDHEEAGDWSLEAVRPVYSVEPAYLESALDYIADNYGETDNFLRRALGLTDEQIEQIKKNLIA